MRQNPNQQFEGSENYEFVVDRENSVAMVQRAEVKSAAHFVFVVLTMTEFFMANLEFMVVTFFKV